MIDAAIQALRMIAIGQWTGDECRSIAREALEATGEPDMPPYTPPTVPDTLGINYSTDKVTKETP